MSLLRAGLTGQACVTAMHQGEEDGAALDVVERLLAGLSTAELRDVVAWTSFLAASLFRELETAKPGMTAAQRLQSIAHELVQLNHPDDLSNNREGNSYDDLGS